MRSLALALLPCLYFWIGIIDTAHAQLPTHDMNEKISLWFQEERFIIADQNNDALLDQGEMSQFPEEFGYYLETRHYQLADANQDGLLSFNEMLDLHASEMSYRYNQEQENLNEMIQRYPELVDADVDYLKGHPELVIELFTNLFWLSEFPEAAESIYRDEAWTERHPEVLLALHRNLRWMATNPADAEELYRDRSATQFLPELLSWRADHKDFIHRHPTMEDFYRGIFVPR